MTPPEDGEQSGLEAALLVLDEYMTSEWPEAASHAPTHEAELLSELSDSHTSTPPPPASQSQAPRRRRSKSQGLKEPALANTHSSSKDASGKKPITWDPNKARNERKGELIYMRKRVADLELKLERLKQPSEHGSPRRLEDSSSIDASTTMLSSEQMTDCVGRHAHGVSCMWRGVAHRQCQERLKSERENVRLKLVLEKQLKIAKTLDKIVTKKAAIKVRVPTVLNLFVFLMY